MQVAERARSARRRREGRLRRARSSPATSSSSRPATPSLPTRGLLQTINLATEEAALTGESLPIVKDARAELADDAPIGDRATMLFTGTSIVRGKGRALVIATGTRTRSSASSRR